MVVYKENKVYNYTNLTKVNIKMFYFRTVVKTNLVLYMPLNMKLFFFKII